MAFDFKKELKEFYQPKDRPEIVTVPRASYIAVRGQGDPNEEGGAYQQAISVLYAVAYTLKMSPKSGYSMEGFFDYVVPPLEGFWRQEDGKDVDYRKKDQFHWISVIRLPELSQRRTSSGRWERPQKRKSWIVRRRNFLLWRKGFVYNDAPGAL